MRKIKFLLTLSLSLSCAALFSKSFAKIETNVHNDTTIFVQSDSAAYLVSSFGGDRLGGNKMNFIDSNIVFRVADSVDNFYKVILSEGRYAFLPKEVTKPYNGEITDLYSTTGSFSANNEGGDDVIHLSLTTKRPYIVYEEADPHKIIVELYGTYLNSVWMTQYLDLEAVKSINLRQKESDVVEMEVNLINKSAWGYNIYYKDNMLVILVKHAPAFRLRGMTIGLDAGHGGSASGAVSKNGDKEKELNMDMVYTLKKILEGKGAKVVLSRDGDVDMTMQRRKEIFRDSKIDLLISIHCNAGGASIASGTSTYYKYTPFRPLAEKILNRLLQIDGVNQFGLIGNFNFSLNGPVQYPNVLVETLFLSNKQDLKNITNPFFREKMMKQVVKGVEDYLKYCKKSERK